MLSDVPTMVPKSVSFRRSGSLGGGGLGVGGGAEATTGGDGGRRDAENIGRARVSTSAPRGIAHKGLPPNELSPGREPASARASSKMKIAAARSALARQIGQPEYARRSAAMTKLAIANVDRD